MSAMSSVRGVVVVGVGIAGRIRIRDLQENVSGFELKGFISRRELEIPGVSQLSIKDALSSSSISVVIVCTEPATHEEYVRQSLENGKHVLVEYPVALNSTSARELFALAAQKGLVLHEENIGLLTESHQQLKEMAKSRQLKTGTSTLIGNYNGWVEKLPLEGKPFLSSTAALQGFYDIFGDIKAVSASLDIKEAGIKFCGEFSPKAGNDNQKLFVKGERSKERVQRSNTTVVEFENGEVFDSNDVKSAAPTGQKKPGLFMQDLAIFEAKICGERSADENSAVIIRCLELAEEANKLLK